MGGFGSGRWYRWRDAKDLTDESLPLDIRDLHRKGLLRPGHTFTSRWWRGENKAGGSSIGGAVLGDRVVLQYSVRKEPVEETVFLDWTPCHYGGRRPWWRCPRCARRAAVLYGAGRLFLCRKCCDLAYPSQRETAGERARRKALAIRVRLGATTTNMMAPFPDRPKGMHLDTYMRLFKEAARAEDIWLQAMQTDTARLCAHTERLSARYMKPDARRNSRP